MSATNLGKWNSAISGPQSLVSSFMRNWRKCCPPIDAVFALGSVKIEEWLHQNNWDRQTPPNNNFAGASVVDEYERVWAKEYALSRQDDVYAVLGGWHFPWPDGDWFDLINGR